MGVRKLVWVTGLAVGLAGGWMGAGQARGALIASDGFGDGDYNNDGTTDGVAAEGGTTDVGLKWLRARGNSNSTFTAATASDPLIDAAHPNVLALNVIGTTSQRIVAAAFPSTTIGVDQQIVLEFDVRALAVPTNGDRSFRFGLFNSNGTPAIESNSTSTDPAVQPTADDIGYIGRVEAGVAAGATLEVQRNTAGQVLGGGVTSFGASSSDATASVDDTDVHRVLLALTRTLGGLSGQLTFDGVSTTVGTDASPLTFTFDEVVIGTNGTTMTYNLDNVRISVNDVPEAGVGVGIGLAVVAAGRRRRR